MASVTNPLNGLSYLTQQGGLLSSLPVKISSAELQSASPQDVVNLSVAALQNQEVDGIFGISSSSRSSLITLPAAAASSASSSEVLPGVSSADLTNASPQQQAALNDQALQLQQVDGLFGASTSTSGSINLLA